MPGEPVVTEASVMLHQPVEHRAFFWGSHPCIMGPWRWLAAPAPGRVGMQSDLCLHTGFLVVAAVTLTFHARLWSPL